jgi:FdhE protein
VSAPDVDDRRSPWAAKRARAEALRDRYPFAAEVLTLYLGLLDVWPEVADRAAQQRPPPRRLPAWAAEHVVPRVVMATQTAGPEALAKAARDLVEAGAVEQCLTAWLAGAELAPVERFTARASLWAPLVALGSEAAKACDSDPAPRDNRHCPRCGGLPQMSIRSAWDDRLVSGQRQLSCARCGQTWAYSASSCPSCGETTGSRRTVYAEQRDGPIVGRPGDDAEGLEAPVFPHLRVDACASCERYLIDVDLGRDTRAVPEVDELVALPLDLYAADQGLSKITPNLMGF